MSDEVVRHYRRPGPDGSHLDLPSSGSLAKLGTRESLALLGSVAYGRIVFTERALPAVRVVNHALVDGEIVIRTHADAALTRALPGGNAEGVVVAYEADHIDAATHTGWSVVVTGFARALPLADLPEEQAARYLQSQPPWFQAHMSHLVVIHPELVSGRRLDSTALVTVW